MVIKIRLAVPSVHIRSRGLTTDRHERIFEYEGNILYLNCGGS